MIATAQQTLDEKIEASKRIRRNAIERHEQIKKIEHLEEKIKSKLKLQLWNKRFRLNAAKYNNIISDIKAVKDHVDQTRTDMLIEKFTSDSTFDF